jgi:hypothetical protein
LDGELKPNRKFGTPMEPILVARSGARNMAQSQKKSPTAIRTDRAGLPPGTPEWITLALVHETVRVWQPFYSAPISLDEAVTILRRVGQLFSVLSEK